ncbi:hypothetical protein PYW08_010924 [Mythimna loreyi]|uniref:Uncharacterized protein n=1 Tax=Mythimna loreyi TaxID=667449 RepID=A0ACC2Q250_9NEOP|nr:hypothetical protein PYW08_010924 [Mythimna loreyi]
MFNLNSNSRLKKDCCVKLVETTRLYLLDKSIVWPKLLVKNCGTRPEPARLSDFDVQHKTPVVRKQFRIPVAFYGGRHTATMLPGGGIGPECMCHVQEIFNQGVEFLAACVS